MRYFLIIVFSILWNFSINQIALGETGKECAIIKEDSKRLLCYDLVYKITPVSPRIEGVGKWNIREDVSKIDDSRRVFMSLQSSDTFQSRYGKRRNVTLAINCRENKTYLYFSFPETFMSDNNGGGRVTIRLDKQKAIQKSFRESSDNQALGLWSGATSIPFIKSLFGKSSLLMRFAPYNESYSTIIFDIGGIKNAIEPLAEACNWKT